MDGTSLIAPIVLLQAALIMMAVCISNRKSSERNHAIGIQTEATLSSDRAWQEAHRAGAPWSILVLGASFASLLVGVVLFNSTSLPENTDVWYISISIAVNVILMGIMAWRADQAAKHVILEQYLEENYGTELREEPR